MDKSNGRNAWIMWLVGTMVTFVLMIALPTMANCIITNDINSRQRDTDIMTEFSSMRVEQMRQGTILERIDKTILKELIKSYK